MAELLKKYKRKAPPTLRFKNLSITSLLLSLVPIQIGLFYLPAHLNVLIAASIYMLFTAAMFAYISVLFSRYKLGELYMSQGEELRETLSNIRASSQNGLKKNLDTIRTTLVHAELAIESKRGEAAIPHILNAVKSVENANDAMRILRIFSLDQNSQNDYVWIPVIDYLENLSITEHSKGLPATFVISPATYSRLEGHEMWVNRVVLDALYAYLQQVHHVLMAVDNTFVEGRIERGVLSINLEIAFLDDAIVTRSDKERIANIYGGFMSLLRYIDTATTFSLTDSGNLFINISYMGGVRKTAEVVDIKAVLTKASRSKEAQITIPSATVALNIKEGNKKILFLDSEQSNFNDIDECFSAGRLHRDDISVLYTTNTADALDFIELMSFDILVVSACVEGFAPDLLFGFYDQVWGEDSPPRRIVCLCDGEKYTSSYKVDYISSGRDISFYQTVLREITLKSVGTQ